jgi:ketosteroid isomerase-like protein
VLPLNASLGRGHKLMPEEATTPDLVELVRRVREAVNRRDFDAVEGFYAPDAIYRGTEIGMFEGAAAIRGLLEDFVSSYQEFHAEAEEISDIGNGVTFGVTIFKGRLVGGSGQLQLRFPSVIVWTHGLIERQTDYMDIDAARAAAERLAEERG